MKTLPLLAGALLLLTGMADPLITQVPDLIGGPTHPEHELLLDAIDDYEDVADRGGWSPIPDGPVVRPGESSPRIPAVRSRLVLTGDLPEGAERAANPELLDPIVAAGIERFQRRHGLTEDGSLGPATTAALSVPVEDRLAELRRNAELWDQVPGERGARYIVVNPRESILRAYEGDALVLRMPVRLDVKRRGITRADTAIEHVVLQPFGAVPHSIAMGGFVPTTPNELAALTQWVLGDQDWSLDEPPKASNAAPLHVRLDPPVPVYVRAFTAIADEEAGVRFLD